MIPDWLVYLLLVLGFLYVDARIVQTINSFRSFHRDYLLFWNRAWKELMEAKKK